MAVVCLGSGQKARDNQILQMIDHPTPGVAPCGSAEFRPINAVQADWHTGYNDRIGIANLRRAYYVGLFNGQSRCCAPCKQANCNKQKLHSVAP
jgi:hypothetical protein